MSTPSRLLLLDTNIVIHLVRGGPLGQTIDSRFGLRARPERPLISAVTLGEALAFARQRGWGAAKVDQLRGLLRELASVNLNSQPVLERYAEMSDFLRRNGR